MRRMVRERGRGPGLALAVALACASPAAAYEGPLHRALAKAVFVISPAARSRVPERYLGAVYRGAEEADRPDVRCDLHGGASGEGAAEAERLLAFLQRSRSEPWSTNRALVVGRLLHLVADAVVPDVIARAEPNALSMLFAGRETALFREPRDASARLSELLVAAARETRWADDPADDDGARLRASVNLGIEALLRLPPAGGIAVEDDGAVAIFVVDRIAAGVVAASHLEPARKGLTVLEWGTRTVAGESVHRLLVFNPTRLCGREIVLHSGSFHREVPLPLPAHSLRRVEVSTPAGVSRRFMRVETRASDLCPPGLDVSGAIAIRAAARVSGTNGIAPDIDGSPVVPY